MALVHVGPDAAPALTEALASSASPRARTVAAELLGRLGAFGAAQRLVAAVADDPDAGVRAASAHALGRLGLPGSCPTLLEQLEQGGDLQLRLACIRALGEIGGDEAIGALPPLLSNADHRVARAAGSALAAIGSVGRRALEEAAADPASAPAAREQLARLVLREASRTGRRRTGRAA
jgi:HEAT repeat protein